MKVKPTELSHAGLLTALEYWADEDTNVPIYMQQVLSQTIDKLRDTQHWFDTWELIVPPDARKEFPQ